MQKGFIKFYLLIFLSFLMLNSFSSVFARGFDVILRNDLTNTSFSFNNKNYFFKRAGFIVDELGLLMDKKTDDSDSLDLQKCFFRDLKECLDKVDSYNLTLKNLSYSDLISLFNFIENKSKKVLEAKMSFLNKDLDKYKEFFSLLRNGIYYKVSLEHILQFKKFAINSLSEIIDLIDYWSFKLTHKGVQGRIENVFQKKENNINLKLKALFFLKKRLSVFLGKADELISLSIESQGAIDDKLLFDLNKEIVFCISSFFSQDFVPGSVDYSQNLKLFSVNFEELSFRKFLSNHMNILLLEDGSRYLLKDYEAPGFFKRNWLKISLLSVGGTVSGIYIYKNWDDIKAGSSRLGNDFSAWITNSYSSFIGMVNGNFGFNIPGGVQPPEEEDSIGLHTAIEDSMIRLRDFADSLEHSGGQLFGEAFPEGATSQEVLDLMGAVRGNIDVLARDLGDKGERFTQQLDEFTRGLNEAVSILGVGAPSREFVSEGPKRRDTNIGFATRTVLSGEAKEVVESFLSRIDLFQKRLDFLNSNGLDEQTKESLREAVLQLNEIVRSFSGALPLFNEYFKDYEGLVYTFVGVFLNAFQDIILVASSTVDRQAGNLVNNVKVMTNWIKATVPVLLTSIILPLSTAFIARKVLRNKRMAKRIEINNILVNIHKILNVNNKLNVDIFMNDISYYERGLLAFFVNSLELKVAKLFKAEKGRLHNLVQDLKNSDYTINQKLEFIKASWSYNLFETNSIVSDTLIENSFGV